MKATSDEIRELDHLGDHLATARTIRNLSQIDLAEMSSISQATISQIENGKRLPSLEQLVRLAHALNVSLQWFFRGSNFPGARWPDIAIQLRELGMIDIFIKGPVVPGAFRPNEEIIAIILSELAPEPRIVEAIPAVLAWNEWENPGLLKAYGEQHGMRTLRRIAWLVDVTLTIMRTEGLPLGTVSFRQLEEFKNSVSLPPRNQEFDTMGRSFNQDQLPPVSKRWRIGYPADQRVFVDRAYQLLRDWKRRRLGQSLTGDVLR